MSILNAMCIIQHVVHIFTTSFVEAWMRDERILPMIQKKLLKAFLYITEMHIIIPFSWYGKTHISILGCVPIFSEVMVIRCYMHTLAIFLTYDRAMTEKSYMVQYNSFREFFCGPEEMFFEFLTLYFILS